MKLLKVVPDDTNIDFLKWRGWAFAISLLLMAASVGLVATKGLNFGVDFIGGQMIRATFTQSAAAPVAELRGRQSWLWRSDDTAFWRGKSGFDPHETARWRGQKSRTC
jgi:preprotein translocase subunit SecF